MREYKPRAWLKINGIYGWDVRPGDFVRYRGRWYEIYRISQDDGILLSNFQWVCSSTLG